MTMSAKNDTVSTVTTMMPSLLDDEVEVTPTSSVEGDTLSVASGAAAGSCSLTEFGAMPGGVDPSL